MEETTFSSENATKYNSGFSLGDSFPWKRLPFTKYNNSGFSLGDSFPIINATCLELSVHWLDVVPLKIHYPISNKKSDHVELPTLQSLFTAFDRHPEISDRLRAF